MLKSKISEDLEEMIKDIIAHRELESFLDEESQEDLLYAELPCYIDNVTDDDDDDENWKIEILL